MITLSILCALGFVGALMGGKPERKAIGIAMFSVALFLLLTMAQSRLP